jgi:hypothetical protein
MNTKILPIAKTPIIGLQYLAYPLCVLLNYEECFPWFYSNYIQLLWCRDFSPHFTFYTVTSPWLITQSISKDTIKKNNISIHSLIKNCIDSNIYLHSTFDEFYVPNRRSYGKKHFYHGVMIHGYGQKEYYILGFSDRNIFETTKISFSEFEEAFFSKEFINVCINFNLLKK